MRKQCDPGPRMGRGQGGSLRFVMLLTPFEYVGEAVAGGQNPRDELEGRWVTAW